MSMLVVLASRVIHPLLVLLYCANNALGISSFVSFVAVAIYWLAGCGSRVLRLWSFHDLFKAVRSILVYAPSIFFSRYVVKVQETEPYKRTVSTAAGKKFLFRLSGRFDFHILSSSSRASHAFPSLMLTSCSVEAMLLPRYLKSSTCFLFSPLRLFVPSDTSWLKQVNSVLSALR